MNECLFRNYIYIYMYVSIYIATQAFSSLCMMLYDLCKPKL